MPRVFELAKMAHKYDFDETLVQEMVKLSRKANEADPDPDDVYQLELFLTSHPEMWRMFGDLAIHIVSELVTEKSSAAVRTSLLAGWFEMLVALGHDEAPVVEKMVIEQVVLCWIRHQFIEFEHTHIMNQNPTLARGAYWERKLSTSQKRLFRACNTLAKIRKLSAQADQSKASEAAGILNKMGVIGKPANGSGKLSGLSKVLNL